VIKFLKDLGYEEYGELFLSHGITDINVLASVKDADLEAIGIHLVGHKRGIMVGINKLKAPFPSSSVVTGGSLFDDPNVSDSKTSSGNSPGTNSGVSAKGRKGSKQQLQQQQKEKEMLLAKKKKDEEEEEERKKKKKRIGRGRRKEKKKKKKRKERKREKEKKKKREKLEKRKKRCFREWSLHLLIRAMIF